MTPLPLTLEILLKDAMKKGASDVHLKAGLVPVIRKHGVLRPLDPQYQPLSGEDIDRMALQALGEANFRKFLERKEYDLGYGVAGLGRFRINVFRQRNSTRMVIRNIPHDIPNFKDLNLPPVVEKIAGQERGLVLVTGITGSGKSSTLAAMIDHINRTKNTHILTIEDPIEFLIRDRKSIITQREVGEDVSNFSSSIRAALRQDPDVILIGEMRDKETVEIALLAAETGHLVFSTLHTTDCAETINRIVSVYEPHHQQQIRLQLGATLKAVLSQRLCKRKDGKGFVPAVEILINNARIRDMIEDPMKTKNIPRAVAESRVTFQMQTFDQALTDLVQKGLITYEEALSQSTNPDDFAVFFSGVEGEGKAWQNAHKLQRPDPEKTLTQWGGVELEIDPATEDQEPTEPIRKPKRVGS